MRKVLGVLLASALLVGACGGDSGDGGPDPSDDPKAALIEAFEDLGEGEGVSMTLSLASDEASLTAASEGELSEDIAATILDSSLTFGGNGAEDPEEAQAEVVFVLGGEEAVEMVVDGYDLYAHADVPYIMETFGQDPAVIDQQLTQLPPGMEFVQDAVNNEWIHLTGLEQLAQQAEDSGQAGGIPNVSEQQKEIVSKLGGSLDQNSTVTEGDEDGPGTHLEAKLDMRAFAEDFQELTNDISQDLGGTGIETAPTPGADIPEGDITLDAWVDDGTLTQVKLDLVKNAELFSDAGEEIPEGVEELGVLIEIEEFDGDVDVPDDAVEVSFEQIIGAMMGGMGASGSETVPAPGGNEDICEEIKTLPAEQQEPFKDICPDL